MDEDDKGHRPDPRLQLTMDRIAATATAAESQRSRSQATPKPGLGIDATASVLAHASVPHTSLSDMCNPRRQKRLVLSTEAMR
jgi:hypothetical protein